ncbi:MAG TPA: hydroxylamine reductase, partial [Paludibacter sp.]
MFCYQCQEAAKGSGCEVKGVCGKTPEVSALQDLLIYQIKGLSHYTTALRLLEIENDAANTFITDSLFMTITNANFDYERFVTRIREGFKLRSELKAILHENKIELPHNELLSWTAITAQEMESIAQHVGVLATVNEDIRSLRELVIYGLKGMAAYLEHASNLGSFDNEAHAFTQRALVATTNDSLTADELTALVLETGKMGVQVMALLDKANTSSYGNPEITKVNLGVRNNPGILISGHDLKDMEELLKQTEGTGVDVYTHSEMLPANYYPAFKKYSHFVGN